MEKTKDNIFWVHSLSLSNILKAVSLNKSRRNVEIRFLKNSLFGYSVLACLNFLGIIQSNVHKIRYSMGDLRSKDGSSLIYENYQLATQTAVRIVDGLRGFRKYIELSNVFSEDKVNLYFGKLIYNEIFPLIRLLCVVRHYNLHKEKSSKHTIFWVDDGYFFQLQNTWPDKSIRIVAIKHSLRISAYIRRLYYWIVYITGRIMSFGFIHNSSEGAYIAIHNVEGTDVTRRSDLFWYPNSQVDKEKVLIYFDRSCNHNLDEKNIEQIKSMGLQTLCLGWLKRAPYSLWRSVWQPHVKSNILKQILTIRFGKCNKTEKWINDKGYEMVSIVGFWTKFYRKFNIKVHYDSVEYGLESVAQNIALDVVGGVRFGKQRSEAHGVVSGEYGQHPEHVFFSWNSRAQECLKSNKNSVNNYIISGFPYNSVSKENKRNAHNKKELLNKKGTRFIIALYDNGFSDEALFSKKMMLSFYEEFLKWMLDDADVGLIIKSKKPGVIERLPEIHSLLSRAKSTERCILMDDTFGRLPSDAAHAAEIAVGIGISSSVTEAVITGCRGIHCDLTRQYGHPFYKWGYEKVIFDDIDKLLEALKRYKNNPDNNTELGCWSSYIDDLDPFHDGRGGERIGVYIRWLIECFDKGKNRDEAMDYANKLYADMWGRDKVIDMRDDKVSIVNVDEEKEICY